MLDYCATDTPKTDTTRFNEVELSPSSTLLNAVASLSEAQLDDLEDELNFYAFTRLEGPLIRSLKPKLN